MNKAELVTALTEHLDGDRKSAATAVDGLLEVIVRTVSAGDSVSVTGFGVFERRERAARSGRNPRTGEAIQVAATAIPAFRPGAGFRDVVSGARTPGAVASRSASTGTPATGTRASSTPATSTRAASSRATSTRPAPSVAEPSTAAPAGNGTVTKASAKGAVKGAVKGAAKSSGKAKDRKAKATKEAAVKNGKVPPKAAAKATKAPAKKKAKK